MSSQDPPKPTESEVAPDEAGDESAADSRTCPGAPATLSRHTRRILVAIAGGTVVLAGVALLVLPGPGLVVILLGLGILAAEFVWAKRLLKDLRRRGKAFVDNARGKDDSSTAS